MKYKCFFYDNDLAEITFDLRFRTVAGKNSTAVYSSSLFLHMVGLRTLSKFHKDK